MKLKFLYTCHFISGTPLEIRTSTQMELPGAGGWWIISNGEMHICNINPNHLLYFTCEEIK